MEGMDIFKLNVLIHGVMMKSEACNEGEDICHESVVSINIPTAK